MAQLVKHLSLWFWLRSRSQVCEVEPHVGPYTQWGAFFSLSPSCQPLHPQCSLAFSLPLQKKKYIYIYMELLETVCAVISLAEGGSEWLLTK